MNRAWKSAALASLMALGFAGPVAIAAAPTASAHDHYYSDRYDDRYDHDRGYHRGWDRRDDRRDDRYERRGYREGYYDGRRYDRGYDHHWRRGEYLPRSYWGDYRVVDYRRYDLAPPPRGYHYRYDDDRGEYLLVGVATGFILGAIAAR